MSLAARRGVSLDAGQSLAYGLLGLPLAFVSLPLYVLLPHHYAREFGLPLATLGALLLAARLADALIDPWLGRWIDRCFDRSARTVQRLGALAALLLALGLAGLFLPPPPLRAANALLLWAGAALLLTYAAYSLLAIAHQAWGARLGGDEVERGRIVAWREGAGLFGVVLASVLPAWQGIGAMLAVFAITLALGWLAWWNSPSPLRASQAEIVADRLPVAFWQPWRQPAFRGLLGVFLLNGIATAIPATLVLFFIEDRLQAPAAQQPLFLLSYFLAAAFGLPLWLRLVRAWGRATWSRSDWSACWPVWPWAPILHCRAPCWRACWPSRASATSTPRPISAGGTSPPSSTWRWLPAWRCRCWPGGVTSRAAAARRACWP